MKKSFLILLVTSQLFATNWYVRPITGEYGSENGTSWDNAFDGFAGIAWGSITAGDYLYVSGGADSAIYYEMLQPQCQGTSGSRITIIAGKYSPLPSGHLGRVIIDGGSQARDNSILFDDYGAGSPAYITVKGFELREATGGVELNIDDVTEPLCVGIILDSLYIYDFYDLAGVQVQGNADKLIVQNCRIVTFLNDGVQTDCFHFNGNASQHARETIIRNNVILNKNQDPLAHNDAIQSVIADGFQIYNNIIVNDSVYSHEGGGMPFILGDIDYNYAGDIETRHPVILYNNFCYMGGAWYDNANMGYTMLTRYYSDEAHQPFCFVMNNTIITNGPRIAGVGMEYKIDLFVNNINAMWCKDDEGFPHNWRTGSTTKRINAATNTSPIVITTENAHTMPDGEWCTIVGCLGNTAANGTWTITYINSTQFSLNGSTGNGEYYYNEPDFPRGYIGDRHGWHASQATYAGPYDDPWYILHMDSVRNNLYWREDSTQTLFAGDVHYSTGGDGAITDWSDWLSHGGTGLNRSPRFVQNFGREPNQSVLVPDLQSNSPAIDAGEDIEPLLQWIEDTWGSWYVLPRTDIYGNLRDASPDIGAFEYQIEFDTTNWYVNRDVSGGDGSGSSWANAATNIYALNESLIEAGDTIYISGGADSTAYLANGNSNVVDNIDAVGGKVVITKGIDAGHNGEVYFVATSSGSQASGMVMNSCTSVELNNLYFRTNITDAGYTSALIWANSGNDYITLESCNFLQRGTGYVVRVDVGDFWTFNNCYMEQPVNTIACPNQEVIFFNQGDGGHTFTNNSIISGAKNVGSADIDMIQFATVGATSGNYITTVANNFFYFNPEPETGAITTSCLYISIPKNGRYLIYNNIFAIDGNPGMVAISSHTIGTDDTYENSLRIFNNTFLNGSGSGGSGLVPLYVSGYYDTLVVKNNIMYSDEGGTVMLKFRDVSRTNIDSLDVDYNNYYTTGLGPYIVDVSTTYTIPQWVALGYDSNSTVSAVTFAEAWGTDIVDYFTTTGRDIGIDLSTYFTMDIIGTQRDATWDMGALEFSHNWYLSNVGKGDSTGSSWANAMYIGRLNGSLITASDTVYIDGGTGSLIYSDSSSFGPALIAGAICHITADGTADNRIVYTRGKDAGHNGTPIFRNNGLKMPFYFDGCSYVELSYVKVVVDTTHARISGAGRRGIVTSSASYIDILHNEVDYTFGMGIHLNTTNHWRAMYNTIYTDTNSVWSLMEDTQSDAFKVNGGHKGEFAYNTVLNRSNVHHYSSEIIPPPPDANWYHRDVFQVAGFNNNENNDTLLYHHNFVGACYDYDDGSTVNGLYVSGGGGIFIIYNNIFVNRYNAVSHSVAKLESISAKSKAYIYNNIFWNRGSSYGLATPVTISYVDSIWYKNNIFYNPNDGTVLGFRPSDGSGLYKDYSNNIYDIPSTYFSSVFGTFEDWQEYAQTDFNSRIVHVSIVDASSNNPSGYKYKAGSEGINDGVILTLFSDTYDGVERPIDSYWDIGAFEYQTGIDDMKFMGSDITKIWGTFLLQFLWIFF